MSDYLKVKRLCLRVEAFGSTYRDYVLADDHEAVVSLLRGLLNRAVAELPDPEFIPEEEKETRVRVLKHDLAEVLS